MDKAVIKKSDIALFVKNLQKDFRLIGPRKKSYYANFKEEARLVFEVIEKPEELVLDYTTTNLPPKKVFFPAKETLLKFSQGKTSVSFEAPPTVLFGVHGCDITSFRLLDRALLRENPDPYYKKRREATLIFGIDCLPDEHCFCQSTGSDKLKEGDFDLFFWDAGDSYIIDIGSKKDEEVLKKYGKVGKVEEKHERARDERTKGREASFKTKLTMTMPELARLMGNTYESRVWEEIGSICLACGACNITCPTCYCFDVLDETRLNLKEGERYRIWDGCTLEGFAKVATGENFREKKAQRLRHRFFRKGKYLLELHGELGCVGCGRCGRFCLVDILPAETFNKLDAYHKLEKYYKEKGVVKGGESRTF